MKDIDPDALLADTGPAKDFDFWSDVLHALEAYADAQRSSTKIRSAGLHTSAVLAADGCKAWVIACFGEPAVIVLRGDLSPGESTWHAARMLVALGGSPLSVTPDEVGVMRSRVRPHAGWSDRAEGILDRRAAGTLRSMGLPRWLVRRLRRGRPFVQVT